MKKRCLLMLLCCMTIILTACGNESKDIESITLGDEQAASCSGTEHYVEQKMDVSFDQVSFAGMLQGEGGIQIFEQNQNQAGAFTQLQVDEQGVKDSKEVAWLSQIVPDDTIWLLDVKEGPDGKLYICYGDASDNWKISIYDGTTIQQTFQIEKCPGGIDVLEDGNILLPFDGTAKIVDQTGREVCSFHKGGSPSTVGQAFDTLGEKVVCKNEKEDGVIIYDAKNQTIETEIPYAFLLLSAF